MIPSSNKLYNIIILSWSLVVVKVQKSLPLVHKKDFTFELNVNIEPPKFIVALLNFHTQYKDQLKTIASTSKK